MSSYVIPTTYITYILPYVRLVAMPTDMSTSMRCIIQSCIPLVVMFTVIWLVVHKVLLVIGKQRLIMLFTSHNRYAPVCNQIFRIERYIL